MSEKQLQKVIEDAPVELDRVYDRSWKRITQLREADRYRAFALIRWTAFALRPLTIFEITEAVVVEDTQELPTEDLPDNVDKDYVDGEIMSLCSPLLEVHGGPSTPIGQHTVHLTHFTVREYLLHKLPARDYIPSTATPVQLQHTLLAKAYLQYMKYRGVWDITQVEHLVRLGASFRSYAATSWHRHINFGQRGNDETTKLAAEFLAENGPAREPWRSFIEVNETKQHRWPAKIYPIGPLHHSVKLQLTEVAMALIEGERCDVNETGSLGRSALSIACSNGSFDLADMLLKKGASPSLEDQDGLMPIHVAAQNGHIDVVRLLLKERTNTEALTDNALLQTSLTKQRVVSDVLDISFKTPLHHSALHDHTRCVQMLLQHGATLTGDIDNMTPLHYAVSKSSEEMARCFLAAGVSIDSKVKRYTWRQEYREDKLHYTRDNEDVHGSGSEVDSQGLTALHYAALIGCRRMTKFLLDHGANPNAVSDHAETALHLALKRDVDGPKWPNFIDHWSDPVHRIEGTLDTIGYDPEDLTRYSELEALIEAHRSDVVGYF